MKRRNLLLLCAVFLLLDAVIAAVLVGSIVHDRRSLSSKREELAVQVGVTADMTEAQQQQAYAQATGDVSRLVAMRSECTAQNGQIALYLSNEKENTCAVSVSIVLMEDETPIAESGLVEPGWRVETLPMSAELGAGEYCCLARCAFYTMDGNVLLGQTTRQLLLTVS